MTRLTRKRAVDARRWLTTQHAEQVAKPTDETRCASRSKPDTPPPDERGTLETTRRLTE